MEKLDYWRLCDEFSVIQAALLILNKVPEHYENILQWQQDQWPDNFSPVFAALSNAVSGNRLKATIRNKVEVDWDMETSKLTKEETNDTDWDKTTILIQDLRNWLKSRGIKTGFFFPDKENAPDYLDKAHDNYSPKLAAAIRAWEAVNANPDLTRGKTVKQALLKWLRQNADQFGLTKEDGNPNEQGIEEIAKIANWDSKGGAPKSAY